jgi:hypothetical protein
MAFWESTTQYRGYTLQLFVTETSTSTANNNSVVAWDLYIINGSYRFNANFNYSVTIDGSTIANYSGNVNTTDVDYHEAHYLAGGSYTVPHNADGGKTIYCSASCSGGGPNGPGNGNCGGYLTLTTIPRAATITSFVCSNIEESLSVGYNKYVNNWNYYLRLSLSNNTQIDRFLYNTSGASFKLSESAKNIIYNAAGSNDNVTIKAIIESWNGSTKIGESSAISNTLSINRNMWVKIGGTWKRGIPYVNVNGLWKKGIPYIKINGEWRKSV